MENGWKPDQEKDLMSSVGSSSLTTSSFTSSTLSAHLTIPSDPGSGKVWATAPDNDASDVDAAVSAAHAAFQSYRKISPRTRAQWLLKWDTLIRENRDDIANIVTYETGKPLAESQGELDYALGFTWWFAGEAERITGTIQTPAAPGRRVFTVRQPIGVAAALVPWNFPIA